MRDVSELEEAIGHRFADRRRLLEALTHRSFANEQPDSASLDNERLEFLGDAVLGLVVSELLFDRHPALDEGQLSRARAFLVSAANLVVHAGQLELGEYLQLGRGEEKSGGRQKAALLVDAFEALIGALYLDGGLDAVRRFLDNRIGDQISSVRINGYDLKDSKSILQERLHTLEGGEVEYRLVGESGPDHQKTFHVEARVGGDAVSEGTGPTKKSAEQAAAMHALEALDEPAEGDQPGS